MRPQIESAFASWCAALEARHSGSLTFKEIRRAVQAVSVDYVERRRSGCAPAVLDRTGKRAAFALFYGPLHFLVVRAVVQALGAAAPTPACIVDLGCGTLAGGAAWALEAGAIATITGIDRNDWAAREARWTLQQLGLRGKVDRGDLGRARLPGHQGAALAAFSVNELSASSRDRLLPRLLASNRRGARILIIEPIGRTALTWWQQWSAEIVAAGGREDRWRFEANLPPRLALLDRAAGLDHRELTARSLWLSSDRQR